jgi:hypothetical protein
VRRIGGVEHVSTADVFDKALGIPEGRMHRMMSVELADTMRTLGWKECRFTWNGQKVRGYCR